MCCLYSFPSHYNDFSDYGLKAAKAVSLDSIPSAMAKLADPRSISPDRLWRTAGTESSVRSDSSNAFCVPTDFLLDCAVCVWIGCLQRLLVLAGERSRFLAESSLCRSSCSDGVAGRIGGYHHPR